MLQTKTKGPHHIHSLRSSCFTKKSAINVAGNLVTVVKFTFQSVFSSRQSPRHASARGREESLELYSLLSSDWPTSKQKVLRHGNCFAARVRGRYFSGGEKWRTEIRLCPQPNFHLRTQKKKGEEEKKGKTVPTVDLYQLLYCHYLFSLNRKMTIILLYWKFACTLEFMLRALKKQELNIYFKLRIITIILV